MLGFGLIEKALIIIRCRKDLKRDRFSTYQSNQEGSSEILISPFITTELAFVLAKRKRILKKSLLLLNISGKRALHGYRLWKFCGILCRLNEMISETELSIHNFSSQYDGKMQSLNDRKNLYFAEGAEHHVQYLLDQIEELRTEKQKKIQTLQKKLLGLTNEKVRVIKSVNARIDSILAHHVLRIQYYYGYACSHCEPPDPFPVRLFSISDLQGICGEKIDSDHTGELENAQEKIGILIKKLGEENARN